MDNRKVRIQTLKTIHDLQEKHCASCELITSRRGVYKDRNVVCVDCPIGKQLRDLGEILEAKRKPTKEGEVMSVLTKMLYSHYREIGMSHKEIGKMYGRSESWVSMKKNQWGITDDQRSSKRGKKRSGSKREPEKKEKQLEMKDIKDHISVIEHQRNDLKVEDLVTNHEREQERRITFHDGPIKWNENAVQYGKLQPHPESMIQKYERHLAEARKEADEYQQRCLKLEEEIREMKQQPGPADLEEDLMQANLNIEALKRTLALYQK